MSFACLLSAEERGSVAEVSKTGDILKLNDGFLASFDHINLNLVGVHILHVDALFALHRYDNLCFFCNTVYSHLQDFETLLTSQQLIDIINICINSSFTTVFSMCLCFRSFWRRLECDL